MIRQPYAWAVLLLVLGQATALAQPTPPGGARRPAYSPYLGLLAGSNNPGLNYLSVVRPQQQFQQQVNQLSQNQQQAEQSLDALGSSIYGVDPTRALTGHAATFDNTLQYYGSNPAARSGGGGASPFGGGGLAGRPGVGGGPSRGGIGSSSGTRYGTMSRPSTPAAPGAMRGR